MYTGVVMNKLASRMLQLCLMLLCTSMFNEAFGYTGSIITYKLYSTIHTLSKLIEHLLSS